MLFGYMGRRVAVCGGVWPGYVLVHWSERESGLATSKEKQAAWEAGADLGSLSSLRLPLKGRVTCTSPSPPPPAQVGLRALL